MLSTKQIQNEGATHVEPRRPTPRRVPSRDVIERFTSQPVYQWVEEPKRGLARGDARVIQQSDEPGERGG